MNGDRELLESAAKACGLLVQREETYLGVFTGLNIREDDRPGGYRWNPLNDDGDALRLAVKLRMNISFTRGLGAGHRDEYMQVVPMTLGHLAEFGPLGTDETATIRRAIVRAAASLTGDKA